MNVELRIFRAVRNKRLADCDWTILPSSPLSAEKQDEWKVYRQALRDLPKTTPPKFLPNSPKLDESDWPTKPS